MTFLRQLVALALVSPFLLLPACTDNALEALGSCAEDRRGAQERACFARPCGDGDRCDASPVLAGGEFEVQALASGEALSSVPYEEVVLAASASDQGTAELLETTTSCLCDLSASSCDDVNEITCTWQGRFRSPRAGLHLVALRAPDGSDFDLYGVQTEEAASLTVAVVQASRNSLLITGGSTPDQTLTPDAAGVVEVTAKTNFLYLIPAARNAAGVPLATVGDGVTYEFSADGVLRDDGRSGPGQRFEALKAGETTLRVKARAGAAQLVVAIRVR